VQNKYAIDVNNRFAVDEDEIDEEENIDPFEELRQLNKQAEAIKNAPKPKKQIKKKVIKQAPVQEKANEEKKVDKPRRRDDRRRDDRPRAPRNNDDGGAVEGGEGGRRREYRPRGERGDGPPQRREKFDRRSRDPRSSQKGIDKKEGSGTGNWGTAEDELAGQTEKVEEEQKSADEQKDEQTPPEPQEVTMTLEEYRSQKKNVNRNPNAKVEEDEVKTTKKEVEQKRKGRAGRMEPVDFRPAPLVAPRGGDRRNRGNNNNRGDYKQNKKPVDTGYSLENDFPSL